MIEALRDGTVDCIATDHAPHATHEREVEFERAPNGIPGLELRWAWHTASCAATTAPRPRARPDERQLRRSPSAQNRGNLAPGSRADPILFDPTVEWTYSAKHLEGPIWEMRLKGRSGIARACYVTAVGKRVVIVHAFGKKT